MSAFKAASMQNKVQAKLSDLMDIFSNVDNLVNAHVADFFTKNLWSEVLPTHVREDIEKMGQLCEFKELYRELLTNSEASKLPSNVFNFLRNSFKSSLIHDESCLTSVNQLLHILSNTGAKCTEAPYLRDFMSEKKKHEVKKMIPLASSLAQCTKAQVVLDIGGGKGYLSSVLAKHCNLQVLGLDSSLMTTCGAEKREKQMAKIAGERNNCGGDYKCETVLVSRSTDLNFILKKHFNSEPNISGMVGLHTCGDLSISSIHLFLNSDVRWLINIGCCYHLLTEKFDSIAFWEDLNVNVLEESGFPVSTFLKEKSARLGRNARMLSAHSLDRIAVDGINEESARSLFYRAILQTIIWKVRKHHLLEGYVGRLAKKCSNFSQYIHRAAQKLNLDIDLSEEDIQELLSHYQEDEIKLQIFFLIRTHFAPIIESIILLDRLLFLLEQGIEDAYLVPLFDPVISPRRFALVAWKKS